MTAVERMPAAYLTGALRPLEEFVSDPALTVACVLLIVVSVAWVVVARMIWLNLRRAADPGPPPTTAR